MIYFDGWTSSRDNHQHKYERFVSRFPTGVRQLVRESGHWLQRLDSGYLTRLFSLKLSTAGRTSWFQKQQKHLASVWSRCRWGRPTGKPGSSLPEERNVDGCIASSCSSLKANRVPCKRFQGKKRGTAFNMVWFVLVD